MWDVQIARFGSPELEAWLKAGYQPFAVSHAGYNDADLVIVLRRLV